MGCGGSKMVKTDEHIQNCLNLLQKRPDFKKFKASDKAVKDMESRYGNQVFGGSVFLPVGHGDNPNAKRDKENRLEQDVKAVNVDYLYGGGYYTLKFVRVRDTKDGRTYMADIYLLIESIENIDNIKTLKVEVEKAQSLKPGDQHYKSLEFDQIAEALTGFGRIIYYNKGSDYTPEQ